MSSNAFTEAELVKVQGKQYPVVGGRLRLAHEEELQGVTTEVVSFVAREQAIVKATVHIKDGSFQGHGFADSTRDGRLKDALLELAETRAIARALRWAGFGTEFTGAEEVSHLNGKPPAASSKSVGGNPPSAVQRGKLRELSKQLEVLTGEPVNVVPPVSQEAAGELIRSMSGEVEALTK